MRYVTSFVTRFDRSKNAFFFSLLQIAVRYAGVDIPGSPFLMTCNPNIDEVVNAAISDGPGSRKGSALTPDEERCYSKHGTGLQRGSIAEDGKGRLISSASHFLNLILIIDK